MVVVGLVVGVVVRAAAAAETTGGSGRLDRGGGTSSVVARVQHCIVGRHSAHVAPALALALAVLPIRFHAGFMRFRAAAVRLRAAAREYM